MKNFFSAIFLLVTLIPVYAQDTYELQLVGRIWFPSAIHTSGDTTGGSDVWGYTAPDGSEYAIMGVRDGVAFVSVPGMQVIDIIPGPAQNDYYYHRDIKTYKHYAYITNEMTGTNQGVIIVDLQYLPDSVRFVKSYVHSNQVRSHNLSIDTANGFAYILAQNYSGFRIVDLADPENPVDVNLVNTGNIHDVFAQNDTVYVAEGFNGSYSIWDVSDKNSPVMIKRFSPPAAGYAHNIWASEDGRYVMTTEETLNKTVKVWDTSNLPDVELKGQYLSGNLIAHNTHLMNGFAYISHYRDGVVVVDITDPDNPVEVAAFDTYYGPRTGEFYGCWGAYPFAKDGYVYASDLEGYLTVLKLVPQVTGIDESVVADKFDLLQNYPNPFNPSTTIKYSVENSGVIRLSIYNLLGEEVRLLENGFREKGDYSVKFNAAGLNSGVYFCRLQTDERTSTIKMILQK